MQPSIAITDRKRLTAVLMFASGMVLCFDLGGELHALMLYPASFSFLAQLHMVTELLATAGVGLAFVLIRRDIRRAETEAALQENRLRLLRNDFDVLLHRRFLQWGLSSAETDVALLTVRGLSIAEIAEIRSARPGTVKAQLSGIFRKSGVSSRTEFVARFIDDFIDIASDPDARNRPVPDGQDAG